MFKTDECYIEFYYPKNLRESIYSSPNSIGHRVQNEKKEQLPDDQIKCIVGIINVIPDYDYIEKGDDLLKVDDCDIKEEFKKVRPISINSLGF